MDSNMTPTWRKYEGQKKKVAAENSCGVTQFGSRQTAARYTFNEGEVGSLSAKLSGKRPEDSVYWKKGDEFISQDDDIVPRYAEYFTLNTDESSGLHELKFKNSLTIQNAGVYRCTCGNSHFDAAVFINVNIPNKQSKVNGTNLPFNISEAPPQILHFDAGSVYPKVNHLNVTWMCNSQTPDYQIVPVTMQAVSRKMFNGSYTTFEYEGATACFVIIDDWDEPDRTQTGCTVINATSDVCSIHVNDVAVVNYKRSLVSKAQQLYLSHYLIPIICLWFLESCLTS